MTTPTVLPIDARTAYRACSGRESRFDGRLYLGVTSTGIYCRPSCPARTPRLENCRFFASAAACVAAGFRACKRCRPDALPGTRDWDASSDLVARALRLIRDGAMDGGATGGGGVAGLAARLHVSERQLRRLLVEATGATPVQLATTRRAAIARQLIEQTGLSLADIAFAAGFGSVRRFNEAMRAELGQAPSAMARGRGAAPDTRERADSAERPTLALRLRYRPPIDVGSLRSFLTNHAVAGLERSIPDAPGRPAAHERVVPVPGGIALARIEWPEPGADSIAVRLNLPRLDDLMPAIAAVRRWLDLDADPALVDASLAVQAQLAPLVAARPGLRIAGSVDPVETALMVVLGQQVSVKAALVGQARLAEEYGRPAPELGHSIAPGSSAESHPRQAEWLTPPDPAAIAADGIERVRGRLGIDGNRAAALVALAGALADGLSLGPESDRAQVRAQLLALPRVGPWTADLITVRCLGDTDVFAAGDLVARRALAGLIGAERLSPRAARSIADAWRPWRSYALFHLWSKEYHR